MDRPMCVLGRGEEVCFGGGAETIPGKVWRSFLQMACRDHSELEKGISI